MKSEFIWRRLHSLMGLFIVLFLTEHLITNSQAALLFGESGEGFIRAVNFIKNLPYLPVIEVLLIAIPFGYHAILGVRYAITGKHNALKSDGSKPSMPEFGRNRAYTWQRITSWILLVGVLVHVGYMRFYLYPSSAHEGNKDAYFVRLSMDNGLYTVAERLDVTLYNQEGIDQEQKSFDAEWMQYKTLQNEAKALSDETQFSQRAKEALDKVAELEYQQKWIKALTKRSIDSNEVIAESSSFGSVILLNVRDAFKSITNCIFYTIFVLAAVFHAFNGLWTFLITWGLVIRMRSQKRMVNVCVGFMLLVGLLGLASVWGTYWINLRT